MINSGCFGKIIAVLTYLKLIPFSAVMLKNYLFQAISFRDIDPPIVTFPRHATVLFHNIEDLVLNNEP